MPMLRRSICLSAQARLKAAIVTSSKNASKSLAPGGKKPMPTPCSTSAPPELTTNGNITGFPKTDHHSRSHPPIQRFLENRPSNAMMNRTMAYRAWFQCINLDCGAKYPLNSIIYQCPKCNSLLEVQHDTAALANRDAKSWKHLFAARYKR